MDQGRTLTKKLTTIHNALHPKDDFDRQYWSRREGRRWFSSIGNSLDTSIQLLKGYLEKRGGRQVTATTNNTNDTRTSGTTITRNEKWEEKQLYAPFKQLTSDISQEHLDVVKKRKLYEGY